MLLPPSAVPFKEPNTEIKFTNDSYYKYRISYVYNPAQKHTVKKTVPILGKITEQGFVPSPKHQLRKAIHPLCADIKTYGVFTLFSLFLKDESPSLQHTTGKLLADMLLSFAMTRRACQSSIKCASFYHVRHFNSERWAADRALADKTISGTLKTIGETRGLVMAWLKSLPPSPADGESFILMDSTRLVSASEHLEVNANGGQRLL
jgi:hypothetical protein